MNSGSRSTSQEFGQAPTLPKGQGQRYLPQASRTKSRRAADLVGYVEFCLFAILFIVIFSVIARADERVAVLSRLFDHGSASALARGSAPASHAAIDSSAAGVTRIK